MPSDEARGKSKAMAYFYVSRAAFFEVTKYHAIYPQQKEQKCRQTRREKKARSRRPSGLRKTS